LSHPGVGRSVISGMRPETRYARSGEIGIAYQVTGEGDMDLVIAFPFLSHVDLLWDSPAMAHFVRRLGSFARVILFDRRGVGLSDPAGGAPTLEERMDDVRAVMDAAGSERAALLGMSEGATMCMLFAATYPERISALVLWGAMARSTEAGDYPWAPSKDALIEANEELVAPFWGQGATIEIFSPALPATPAPASSRRASSARPPARCGSSNCSACSSTRTCATPCR